MDLNLQPWQTKPQYRRIKQYQLDRNLYKAFETPHIAELISIIKNLTLQIQIV